VGDYSAATPVGKSGLELNVVRGEGATVLNSPTTVAGRDYMSHALDRMQGRGIMPSVVEDTIQFGEDMGGKRAGTTAFYSPWNNVTVVTDSESGCVITCSFGRIGQ
jgi:hypothetical protein